MNDEWWFKERIDERTILTIFGTAKIQKDGYYVITTRKEGNNKVKLHRLIWEDKFGPIPDGYVIHHLNKNKLDNHLENLKLLLDDEHRRLHTNREANPMYGKKNPSRSIMNKENVGNKNPFFGRKHNTKSLIQMSSKKNNTGVFRVSKRTCKRCNRGFIYGYRWKEDGKTHQISSSFLFDLKQKIIKNGFDFIIVDENLFNKTKEAEVLVDGRAKQL